MSKVSLTDMKNIVGYENAQDPETSIYAALLELQGIKMALVSGSTVALRGLYVSGIATEDTLLNVWEMRFAAAVAPVDHSHRAVISGDNYIYLADTTNQDAYLQVLWLDKNP